jgi:glycosyltransferase involved in cell wall biosynthesis
MKKNRLPLLFLVPSLAGGGAERVASNLLPHLAREFDLTLALLENRVYYPVPQGIRLIAFSGKLRSRASHVLRIPLHLFQLMRLVKVNRYPIVLSFMEQANILNVLSSMATGHQAVITQHIPPRLQHSPDKGLVGFMILRASRWLYPRASHVVTVSEGIRRMLLEDYGLRPERATAIPNPIDLEKIVEQASHPPPFFPSVPFLLHVGRLNTKQKAQEVLLQAFSSLRPRYPNLQCVFIGEGPDRARIEERARALGLDNAVFLLGWQSNVAAFMARACLFVLCSRHEGWPMALVEAMACGCPVIATDCPTGPKEILGDSEYGILVSPDNPDELAQAIQRLLENSDLREFYKKQSLRRAQEYDSKHIASRYISLLNLPLRKPT